MAVYWKLTEVIVMSKTALEELKKVIQVNPYLTLESIRSESCLLYTSDAADE